jgi:hypothetical protein
MGVETLVKVAEAFEEHELRASVNTKCKEVVDDIDIEELKEDPMFKRMLSLCIAAKATGVTLQA